jgi:DHA2 family multidrug resistance protein
MSHVNLAMGPSLVVTSGVLQGMGVGLIFVPLSALAFASLGSGLRAEAAGIFTLVRNIGSSVGISIMEALLVQNTATVHADLIPNVRPDNPNLIAAGRLGAFATPHGLALMNAQVGQQAAMVAYADDFKLMMLVALSAIPLLLLLSAPRRAMAAGEVHAVE